MMTTHIISSFKSFLTPLKGVGVDKLIFECRVLDVFSEKTIQTALNIYIGVFATIAIAGNLIVGLALLGVL